MVYDSAKIILAEIEKLEIKLKNYNRLDHGKIRVCAACTTSYHWLPQILNKFKIDFPNVDVDIVLQTSGNPIQEILKGQIDVAIMITPIENANINYRFLFDDELVAVFSNNHPFNHKKYLIAKDFENEHLIIHSKPLNTVVFYEKILKPKGIEPAKISELPLTEATIELIKANYGVAVMSKWSIKPYIDANLISTKTINRNGFFRGHYAATIATDHHPDYLNHFLNYLAIGI